MAKDFYSFAKVTKLIQIWSHWWESRRENQLRISEKPWKYFKLNFLENFGMGKHSILKTQFEIITDVQPTYAATLASFFWKNGLIPASFVYFRSFLVTISIQIEKKA